MAAERPGWRDALLHRERGAGKAFARYGFYDLVRRERDFSEGAANPRCGANGPDGPHADRNRLPFPGPDSLSRQAQRTYVCEGSSAADRRITRVFRRRNRTPDHAKLLPVLFASRKAHDRLAW